MLDICLLGTGGMLPLPGRHLTAMLARCNGSMLLIDCGEGTQVTMRTLGWGFVGLDYILFTHVHADHIAGLPGLLLSLNNYGRRERLTIVGPKGIAVVVEKLRVIAPDLLYPIEIAEIPLQNSPHSFRLGEYEVSALRLEHTIGCLGYSLRIPRAGKFDPDRARALNIPLKLWSKLQNGETIGGFTPDMVLGPERKGLKVSYITDSRPVGTIPDFIRNSDLFICEGLYGDDAMKQKAAAYGHMVFSDAAGLAKSGNVGELWLTHYSQSMPEPAYFLNAAKNIFKNSVAGTDRMTKTLMFED